MFRKRIIDILHEHREDIYRVFLVGKLKFRIFSHKYAFRELQEEIKQLKKEYGSVRLEIQQMNQEISSLFEHVTNNEKKALEKTYNDNQNILSVLKSIQKEYTVYNNDLQNNMHKQYEDLSGCMKEVSSRQEELTTYLRQQEEVIKALKQQSEMLYNIQQQNKELFVLQKNSKRESEKINTEVAVNRKLLQKIEFENETLQTNSIVHLSAYVKKGNAGDNLLVPALRDSIEKSIDMPVNWCHKSVRDVLDDETVQSINNSKGLLIGGGGLFLKDTNTNEISGWQWPCSLNELDKIKVPMYILGVGYNRFRGQDDFEPYFIENINEVVRKSKFVGLRNNGSVRAIQQYLDENLKGKVHFHPCATTVLSKLYRMPSVNVDKPFIAVNCAFDRSNMRYGERKEEILRSITNVLKHYSLQYNIKYYAHMQSDKEILPYFDEVQLQYEVVDLDNRLATDDFLRIYSEPVLVLAMRGHAQLIPFGCQTPVLSIISHDKLQWFLEDIGHIEWGIDVREDEFYKKLMQTMQYMLSNLSKIKTEIVISQEKLWEITKENIKEYFKLNE